MIILVIDNQGILSEEQMSHAKNRLHYSLARFSHRVSGATLHLALDEDCEQVKCSINVCITGADVVSVNRTCISSNGAISRTVDAAEPLTQPNPRSPITWTGEQDSMPTHFQPGWCRSATHFVESWRTPASHRLEKQSMQNSLSTPHFDVRTNQSGTFSN